MKLKFFNLNINHKDREFNQDQPKMKAQYWLGGESPTAPIFYGKHTCEEILSNPGVLDKAYQKIVPQFLTITQKGEEEKFIPIFVTIEEGYVWVYTPKGRPKNGERFGCHTNRVARSQNHPFTRYDVPKFFEIKHLVEKKQLDQVPYILAAMKSSRAFAQGTFRCIEENINGDENLRYEGNVAALKVLLNECGEEHFKNMNIDPLQDLKINPIHCLSSVQLETLIAKIFEAQGYFVPAYRGAVLKDVDLFVYPPEEGECFSFSKNDRRLNVQIKINTPTNRKSVSNLSLFLSAKKNNLLITSEVKINPNLEGFKNTGQYLTLEWLKAEINQHDSVRHWYEQSIQWLPKDCRIW